MIITERLVLRSWREEDFFDFAKLNADPLVMRFEPSLITPEDSFDLARKISNQLNQDGWGLWAVSLPGIKPFIGFIGVEYLLLPFETTPVINLNCRLARDFWGMGYATEGAHEVIEQVRKEQHVDQLVGVCAKDNRRACRLFQRLGFILKPEWQFVHPLTDASYVVYELVTL